MNSKRTEHGINPWTDVISKNSPDCTEVQVWGRTYRFAKSALPSSIVTAKEEILAAPIRLAGIVDGKPIAWNQGSASVFRSDHTEATVSGWQSNEALIVNTSSRIGFDGLMRITMVVMGQRGSYSKWERLWLEIPLKSEKATLFTYWPSIQELGLNSGVVSDAGLALPFRPMIWLGWEDGGLSWVAESDQAWTPSNTERCLEVVRQAEVTLLRLHLLDSEPAPSPQTFVFGLQATPVKPMPHDFHEWRVCHGATYGMEKRPMQPATSETELDHAVRHGVKTLVYHESWTEIQNYWQTRQEEQLQSLVHACHQRGVKLLLYFGYEISTLAPEWGECAQDVLAKNPSTPNRFPHWYQRDPPQRDYIVCYNSQWQDRLVDGIARALDEYGFDGLYLDGTSEPWGCVNERHGCGYRDSSGKWRPTYPIFAVRNLMKRLYELVHARDGLVNVHQSTNICTPTLAFCDSYWDGEQFQGGELAGDSLRTLPLAAFRAEFMGVNFGIPCEFLVYERPPSWTYDHALAFTLLHNVRPRPYVGRGLEKLSLIWKAMTDFGVGKAEWHPYWRNEGFVKVEPATVKVSFYRRAGRFLLVVSNLSATQEAEARIKLNTKALADIVLPTSARDGITDEKLALDGDGFRIHLSSMRARIVRLD